MLLAGDIGGTKTRLAVFDPEAGLSKPLKDATYASADYDSLESIVREYLRSTGIDIERAAFGVAGPVVGGVAEITNLPWVIDEAHLRKTFALRSVVLLNDLTAISSSVPFLAAGDLFTLQSGHVEPGGAIAVIAPGTGLGEGFLVYEGGRYCAQPSEGGHTDFAPASREEIDLLDYLFERLGGHVSYERLCSGIGIPNIYAYLRDTGKAVEPDWLREKMEAAEDQTPIIAKTAIDPAADVPLCRATMDMFVSILGSEAGNLALKVLATGGVYLGGGIPPRIIPALQGPRFLQAFHNKGRLSDVLESIPVHVIMNPMAALIGAAHRGMEGE